MVSDLEVYLSTIKKFSIELKSNDGIGRRYICVKGYDVNNDEIDFGGVMVKESEEFTSENIQKIFTLAGEAVLKSVF